MHFFQIFRRKAQQDVRSLRIDGVRTVMTPKPDDAELAAQALLEKLSEKPKKGRRKDCKPGKGSAEYYRALSRRIQESHEADARLALRCVAWCETELKTGSTQPSELEQELYRHMETVEREGGELKDRWQHCLAECIVRQMDTNILTD